MSPNAEEVGSCGPQPISIQLCTGGAQINFGDLTPYLTFDSAILLSSHLKTHISAEELAVAEDAEEVCDEEGAEHEDG
jgi:hypothetical protein